MVPAYTKSIPLVTINYQTAGLTWRFIYDESKILRSLRYHSIFTVVMDLFLICVLLGCNDTLSRLASEISALAASSGLQYVMFKSLVLESSCVLIISPKLSASLITSFVNSECKGPL